MKIYFRLFSSLIVFFILLSVCFLPLVLTAETRLHEALFYQKLGNKLVQCAMCPRRCVIPEGMRGFCGVRENQKGTLYTLSYAKLVSMNDLDPIEKKPFFHFLPGTRTFSVATAGCNLKCKFCQNWEISQARPDDIDYVYVEPAQLINKVKASGLKVIAYTYTEPTIFYEYMLESAQLARKEGMKNVMHSNGFINEEPLRRLAKFLDAANIDLKGFNDEYYKKMSEGTLAPVLNTLKVLREEGVHLEITTLIVPGFNDNEEEVLKMCLWIKENLGPDTPLHFSRFYPLYKLAHLAPTSVDTLDKCRDIALKSGLRFVYIGNVPGYSAENTYCPRCKKVVVGRKGCFVNEYNIKEGRCKFCGEKIAGVWS